jgi:hypothetical protein
MMVITNQTSQDYWFGPFHLRAGVGQTLTLDDTTENSLYLRDDSLANAIRDADVAGVIQVSPSSKPYPRPTGSPELLFNTGSPEDSIYAHQGSVYLRSDSTDPKTGLYFKTTTCNENTGWETVGSYSYTDLTGLLSITVHGTSNVPTVVSSSGYRIDQAPISDWGSIPAATFSMCTFSIVLSDTGDGTGNAWALNGLLPAFTEWLGVTLGGGQITAWTNDGMGNITTPADAYALSIRFGGTNGLWLSSPGTDPNTTNLVSLHGGGIPAGYVRHNFPFASDRLVTIEGFCSGIWQEVSL